MANQAGQSKVAGTAWVFGLYAAPGLLNDVNNGTIGLGYRQPTGTGDSFGMVRSGTGAGVKGGDVWLLDRYDEDFAYAFDSGIDLARIAHVQLSNINVNHFYTDLWYKFYLTPHHTYSNVTKPYMGFGIGVGALFYSADFTGMEWFVQRDMSAGWPYTYNEFFTPIDETRFPFNRFRNHLFYYDWTMYIGIERGRFGLQMVGGLNNRLGGSPLILPYLNQRYIEGREAGRKLEEDGLLVYSQVFEADDPRKNHSTGRSPLDTRLTASVRLTWRFN